MLIDATHPEETRVVVADGNKVEDFDFETISKKQIAGNIYLAKVTRVEPSLQAAFVEYGGNRHGFLAFSEIHPDYYQIPKADREALMAEEEEEARRRAAADEDRRAARQAAAAARAEAKSRDAAGDDDEDESDDDGGDDDSDDRDDSRLVGESADEDDDYEAERPETVSEGEDDDDASGEDDARTADASGTPEESSDNSEKPEDDDDGSPRVMAEAAGAGDDDDERVEEDYVPPVRRPEDEAAAPTPSEAPTSEAPAEAAAPGTTETPAETAETSAPETPAPETPAEEPPVAEISAEPAPVAEAPAEAPAQEPQAEARAEETTVAAETPADSPAVDAAVETAAAPDAVAEAPAEDTTAPAETSRTSDDDSEDDDDSSGDDSSNDDASGDEASGDKRRRRSRRGGRSRRSRRSKADDAPAEAKADPAPVVDDSSDDEDADSAADARSEDGDDLGEGISARRIFQRRYKIQEVIKVRQILLVQVVKEERGNKGAALTTYLSLAGRYCVLMPNTARGGGISRKITNAADRKKLKDIAGDIEVPRGMGLIIRTAGAKRTAQEIERDYEYLLRQWERIRETTLRSVAPTLIYEEGSLIKRAIRDLYAQGIDQICVDGDEGYKEAKDYMSMLMPGHARNVVRNTDSQPLFAKHGVEQELNSMFNPTVQLKSGGYIVIGVTEALVAIDINSGKSTKEGSIEDTALKTNLEAADEIARQLRLRDLAGLIVIDFIDMEDPRNNRSVEKRMKDKLKIDRARIQVGRISAFGLMEMSRQRLRPGVLEATTAPCAHCHGTGVVRADSSLSLTILRQLEGEAARGRAPELSVRAPMGTASYLLNDKRDHLSGIEARHGVVIRIEGDPSLFSPEFHVERIKTASRLPLQAPLPVSMMDAPDLEEVEEAEVVETPVEEEVPAPVARAEAQAEEARPEASDDKSDEDGSRRRRGRRGGRRRKRGEDGEPGSDDAPASAEKEASPDKDAPQEDAAVSAPVSPATLTESDAPIEIPEPKRTRRRRKPKKSEAPEATAAEPEASSEEAATHAAPANEPPQDAKASQPDVGSAEVAPEVEASLEAEAKEPNAVVDEPASAPVATEAEPVAQTPAKETAKETSEAATQPKRRGWWALKR